MERRPDRFTAVLDADALCGALTRNLLLRLAEVGLFRPKWSDRILGELRRACLGRGQRADYIERVVREMRRSFPEAGISSFEHYEFAFDALPDADDRHVVAAAIKCNAATIVTWNLRDFPESSLAPLGTQAIAPDDFIADLIDLDQALATDVVERMRKAFRAPEYGPADLIARMREVRLTQTAAILVGAGYGS